MILGICGSPRKAATNHVLSYALEKLENNGFETKSFLLRAKKIAPCIHCDYCLKHKECVQKDDMTNLYALLKEAEGIIMATPVYNGGISGQLKCIMDRCRALGAEDINSLRGKIGLAIAVGGDRSGGQEPAIQQIHSYYILNGIVPISGGSFGANLGASFWSKDKLEEVKKDEYGFKTLNKTLKYFTNYLEK
ncbi:2-amino-4-deoxychorismate dehydrogenase [Methanobrevibacter filiformis]|uniref:2-amino-4-deoxychorismate dehydrogenase n=2 Tax=Methanobrevibacter filiformis TaxID=55758 RepID=A0A162FGA9_9EURY|nr:2-amino-4-deoxychorismate dehydrogenase [Methanobrevibacter filiformis]